MADATLNIEILARDLASGVLKGLGGNLGTLGSAAAALGIGFNAAQQATQAFTSAVGQLVSAGVGMDALLETTTLQFTTLQGSADHAREHVADLFQIAKETPFETAPIIEASRNMEVFGGAALDTHRNILMIGDAAAATNAPIDQLSFWVGRLYSELQAGRPIGESARYLQQLAVLSPQVRNQLEDMQKSGASATDMWRVFTDSLQRFNGAMRDQAQTWKGLTSTFSDSVRIMAGTALHESFVTLEGDLKRMNDEMARPEAQRNAERLGVALGALTRVGVATGESMTSNVVAPMTDVDRITMDTSNLIRDSGSIWTAVLGRDVPGALAILQQSFVETASAGGTLNAAADQARDAWGKEFGAIQAGIPVAKQARDAWEDDEHALIRQTAALDAGRAAMTDFRDETVRANEASTLFAEQHQAAYAQMTTAEQAWALMSQHTHAENADALADIHQREAQDIIKDAKEAQQAQEQAARDASKAEQEAAQQAQEAIRRAYGETADEAEAAYARIANAALAPTDTLQQQLDEARNRQARAGTTGTAGAEKELDDIRRAHLATLGDLAALDQDYAAAQDRTHQADLAVAAAERDLAVALARSGGAQTLQTAALAHAVTARKAEADATRDAAAAIARHRSQVLSDTSALEGLAKAQDRKAAATSRALDLPGGGLGIDPRTWSLTAEGNLAPPVYTLGGRRLPPPSGSVSLEDFKRGVRSAEYQALHVTVNVSGNVYGTDQLDKHIENAIRSGDIRVVGR